MANRLPTWKAKLLNKAGRVALTKSTLAAIPVHVSIVLALPPWAIKALDKLMMTFFWQGTAIVAAGQCTVAWQKVCRPTVLGGLGIPNLKLRGLALRIRLEWLRHTDPSRTRTELPSSTESVTQQIFAASVTFIIGDGRRTLFWKDKWLDGQSIEQLAPWVFNDVPKRTRNARTVHDALQRETWIDDITGAWTVPLIH